MAVLACTPVFLSSNKILFTCFFVFQQDFVVPTKINSVWQASLCEILLNQFLSRSMQKQSVIVFQK
jgi:hypothetical protein